MQWRSFAVAVLLCLSLAAFAQVELPRLTEVVEVRVTNIDVVVTDERGARVHGLTKDDFEVYDGGTRQEITNFSEIASPYVSLRDAGDTRPPSATPPPPIDEAPARHIVVFFDNFSTSTQQRKRVAEAIVDLFRDLRPVDDAMIVSWNRAIKIVVPPTNDRAALEAGLAKAARETSLRGPGLTKFPAIGGLSALPGEDRSASVRQRLEAAADQTGGMQGLNTILSRLAALEGRKALILVSAAFSSRTGEEGEARDDGLLADLNDSRAADTLRSLTTTANAAGIAIYSIHAVGLQSGMSAADSKPDDMLGRMRADGGSADGLGYLSARTGGFLTANTNGFRRGVARIAEDLSSYYSIGYRSALLRNNRERDIKVVARNSNFTVRARHTAVARAYERELTDRVVAALLYPSDSNQLGISARVVRTDWKKRNQLSMPVDVIIPMSGLTFNSDGKGLAADISIYIASADKTGSSSMVEQFRQRIPVTREQLPTLGRMHYTYGLMVDLKTTSAENRLAIAVMDNIARTTGLTTLEVAAPVNAAR